jgi:hypothetical protein
VVNFAKLKYVRIFYKNKAKFEKSNNILVIRLMSWGFSMAFPQFYVFFFEFTKYMNKHIIKSQTLIVG